jgi:protein TonB
MPLVNCPECGGSVSSTAPTCPHCGHANPGRPAAPPPISRSGGPSAGWFLVAFALVAVLGVGVFGWGVYHLLQRYNHPQPRPPEELVDYREDSVPARPAATPPEALPGVADSARRPMAREGERTPPPDSGTYELSAVETQPELVNREQVKYALSRNYPPLLRDAGVSGSVTVQFRITRTGEVDPATIKVLQSTHEAFSDAAVRVVMQMRFSPAWHGGSPVPVWITLPVTFQITP